MAYKDSLVVLPIRGCYTILGKTDVQCVRRTGMSPLTLSCVVFAVVVSGIFTGMLLRRLLPEGSPLR